MRRGESKQEKKKKVGQMELNNIVREKRKGEEDC